MAVTKKTTQQMVDELMSGVKSTAQSDKRTTVNKVDAQKSSYKPVNTNRDFGLFDVYMEKLKKEKSAAPSVSNLLPYNRDERTIERYESIPNYNVFERAFDKSKAAAYKEKQSLLDAYQKAQNRQAQKLMSQKDISQSDLASAYVKAPSVDWVTGEKDVLMDAVDKYILHPEQRKAAENNLRSKGITDEQNKLLKEYYKRMSLDNSVKNMSDFADEHEVLGTLASFPINITGTLHSALGNTGAYLNGNPIDGNGMWNVAGNSADEMRQSASKDLNAIGKFAYDVGVSIGDMVPAVAASFATGGASAAPMIVSGLSAYGDSTREGASRGLTPNQIMATGASNAVVEAAFEKIPFDNLTKIFSKGGKDASRFLVKEIASQMGSEAFEEMGTELINTFADAVINGDKSHFALNKQNYISQGMTEEEATKRAYIDVAKNVGYSGAAGAVSGGIMGGGASVINRIGGNTNVESNVNENTKNVSTDNVSNKVGRATTIISPYSGEVPQQNKTEFQRVDISQDKYDDAVTSINTANIDKVLNSDKSIKTVVQKVYESLFGNSGEAFHVPVEGATFDGIPYIVDVNKSSVGKLVKDGPISVEKMCVLSDIDNVLSQAEYVGSANYDNHNNKNSGVIRYDYFETPIRLNGVDYIVTFDVEIQKGSNRYRMHRVINEMNLTKATGEANVITAPEVLSNDIDTAQKTGVSSGLPGSSNNSIPNSSENVNVTSENGNQRVRGYNDTLVNKTDAPQDLKNEFINNPDIYTQLSNAETLENAMEIMQNNDIQSAISKYHELLSDKNPVAVPLGYNLSKQLSQAGKLDESVQIVREMSKALTESGQFSQAAAITMLNNDPEAAKRYMIREIDALNQKGKETYKNKWKDFELTESELQQFNDIEVGDTDAIKQAYDTVYSRLRKEYPSTMTEKLMEFRRVSMLLNSRTNVRNVVSNALLFPVRWTADRVSALGEGVYSLIDPKYQRTHSINPIRSKQSKKLASEAFETVKTELLGDNKYEDSKGAIRDKQVFKGSKTAHMLDTITNGAVTKANKAMGKDINPSLMETARNFTYWLLEKGDDVFVRKNFESRMASYIDAQGISDLDSIPSDAYTLATQEAFKATFKDDSALARSLSVFRQMLNDIPGHFVGDAVMPFTKTPANLAMRGIDYSPVGVIKAFRTFKKAKNNVDVAKGITQLGQAATGTAAIAIGYVLAGAGFLKGELSDDKDEAQFQKQQGELAYSIKTPFGYLTYDWAQPASIPLVLGVSIYDSLSNNEGFVSGILKGSLAAIDSWLELSPLQNLSDIFGGYGSPAENVADVLTTDLPLSFLPAQLGAAARVKDTNQRVTYDQNSYWNNLLNQAKAKIPGLSETLPVAYDTWGNPIKRQDSTVEAAFANLLNPGQFGNESVTPIDDEISALYDATNDASVFPRKAKWTENDVKLDNKQYSEFQRIMGENAYAMANAFINSKSYDSIDDEIKVKAIGEMYSFANALAKSEVTGYDIENSQAYKKAYSVYREKGAEGVAIYYAISANKEGQKNIDIVNAVNSLDISNEDKGYYISVMKGELSKEATNAYNSGGYEGLYNHFVNKTEDPKGANDIDTMSQRIESYLQGGKSSSQSEMEKRISDYINSKQSGNNVSQNISAQEGISPRSDDDMQAMINRIEAYMNKR